MRVISLESRRGAELASLIARHGGEAVQAPSMAERPLKEHQQARAFGQALFAGKCDLLVLLTGVGARMLFDVLALEHSESEVRRALEGIEVACRGPKPVAILKAMGLKPSCVAPEPNTWRELLQTLDDALPLQGKRLWVQEYGRPNAGLLDALVERGAVVHRVPIYAWTMPEELGPLRQAVRELAEASADAVLFTSAQQGQHLFQVARELDLLDALVRALRERVLVASIGPVTSEALGELGVSVDLEPARPKMGPLAVALMRQGPALLAAKRGD